MWVVMYAQTQHTCMCMKMNQVTTSILLYLRCRSLWCRHEAERMEQEAKGRLERQKITDEAEAEKARRQLLELQAKRCEEAMLAKLVN